MTDYRCVRFECSYDSFAIVAQKRHGLKLILQDWVTALVHAIHNGIAFLLLVVFGNWT